MNTFELRQNLRYYNQRFSEMPVGDPMSGAPYGEYLKSKAIGAIIGVVAAIATVGAAAPIIAGAIAGTASIGAGIAAGAMAAGGVMTGVGAVTGNKKLMKIGGVLALAGGLGSLALGSFSTASSVAGEAVPGTVAAEPVAEGAMQGASEQLTGKLGAASTSEAFGASAEGMNAGALSVDKLASANVSDLGGGVAQASGNFTGAGQGGLLSESINAPSSALTVPPNDVVAYTGKDFSASAVNQSVSPTVEEGGFLNKAGSWMDKNKTLVEMGGKLLSNLGNQAAAADRAAAAGGGSGSTEANNAYLTAKANETNASAEALRTKQAAEEQQRRNANTQVMMISASDPNRDAKVADAVARGVPYQIMFQPAAAPVSMSGQNYATTSNQWAPQR